MKVALNRKKIALYISVGFVAFLVFFIANFPASTAYQLFVASALDKRIVQIQGIQGSVWNGAMQSVRVSGINLGRVKWKLAFWPLLTGSASLDLAIRSNTTQGSAQVSVGLAGRIVAEDVRARLPAQILMSGNYGLPIALAGDISLELTEAIYQRGKVFTMEGRLVWHEGGLTAPQAVDLGSLLMKLTPKDNGTQATLQDQQGGVYKLDGTLRVRANGQYKLAATVQVRDNSREDLKRALYFLGRPGRDGSVRMVQTGQLKGW